jgi:tRNA threonylcarbamoyladenosine biosynthesis protein TsaB
MSWLLALHSSSAVLGVGVQRLDRPEQPPRLAAFDLGRGLSNRLLPCIEELLPAGQWSQLARLAVATGPGGFTGTRLTVVLARTLAQQLQLPLDGPSSVLLAAARRPLAAPTWLWQPLARRGVVAGLYAPDPAAAIGVVELEAPRLMAAEEAMPPGPRAQVQIAVPGDLQPLLALAAAHHRAGLPAPWQPVLPLYPTSPVDR